VEALRNRYRAPRSKGSLDGLRPVSPRGGRRRLPGRCRCACSLGLETDARPVGRIRVGSCYSRATWRLLGAVEAQAVLREVRRHQPEVHDLILVARAPI